MASPRECPFCLEPPADCVCDDGTRDPATPAAGEVPAIRCPHCLDDGMVCEDHPQYPAHVNVEGHRGEECGAGMPCPSCCSPIPEDGTVSITQAFVPDWKRA